MNSSNMILETKALLKESQGKDLASILRKKINNYKEVYNFLDELQDKLNWEVSNISEPKKELSNGSCWSFQLFDLNKQEYETCRDIIKVYQKKINNLNQDGLFLELYPSANKDLYKIKIDLFM